MSSRNRKKKNKNSSNNNAAVKNVKTDNNQNNHNTESLEFGENIEQTSEDIAAAEPVQEVEAAQAVDEIQEQVYEQEEAKSEMRPEENKKYEEDSENKDKIQKIKIENKINDKDREKTEGKISAVDFNQPHIFKTAAVLGVITLVVAFMLSVLNGATAPIIKERAEREKAQAVENLFGEDITIEKFDGKLVSPVVEILYVRNKSDNSLIGYCVNAQPKGYSGKIDMLIALNTAKKITGVNILDINETPNIGSKAGENDFLSQFNGKSDSIDAKSIDIISGATISSKAVLNGINKALENIKGIGE